MWRFRNANVFGYLANYFDDIVVKINSNEERNKKKLTAYEIRPKNIFETITQPQLFIQP